MSPLRTQARESQTSSPTRQRSQSKVSNDQNLY